MSDWLPVGWAWATPPDLASPERHSLGIGPFGSNLKVSDYSDHGVPLVFVRNIRAESFDDNDPKFVTNNKAKELEAHAVHPGDVLITKMGEPPGDSALYPLSRPVGIITADCIRWRIDTRLGEAQYFVYATRTANVREQILGITRGVAQRKVSVSRFKCVRYRVAPPTEQRRIVEAIESYFTRLDDAVATLERVQRNLKRYRASVLKAAVEGRLVPTEAELACAEGRDYEPASVLLERILAERRRRWEETELVKMTAKGKTPKDDRWKAKYKEPVPPDTSELLELPEGWTWTSLGQVFNVCVGATPPRNESEYWGGGIPWVSSGEVSFCRISETRETISEAGLANSSTKINPAGSVLLGMIGEGKTRGQSAILDIAACNNQNCAAIWVSETELPPEYVYSYLVEQYEVTRTRGSGNNQPALNKARVQAIPFPLPPVAEARRIVEEAARHESVIGSLVTSAQQSRRRCQRLRQSILKWAFEGRLVDQDPTDEPASVLLERIRLEREAESAKPARAVRKKRARKSRS